MTEKMSRVKRQKDKKKDKKNKRVLSRAWRRIVDDEVGLGMQFLPEAGIDEK